MGARNIILYFCLFVKRNNVEQWLIRLIFAIKLRDRFIFKLNDLDIRGDCGKFA